MKDERKKKQQLIEELAELRQRLAGLEMLETERKMWEDALEHRIEFDDLITALSTNFINLAPDEIDLEINRALEWIGQFVGSDRSYVFMLAEDGETADNTHEWCADGIEPQIHELKGMSAEAFPWFAKMILGKQVVHVPRTADLPGEAVSLRELLDGWGIQSMICVPMVYGGSVVGFLGLDAVREEREWSDESIALLKIVGQIFVNALERKRTDETLRESEDKFRALVQQLPDGVCIHEKGRIIFSNESHWRMLGFRSEEEIIGADGFEFIAPESREIVRGRVHKRLLDGDVPARYEIKSRRRDGSTFDSELVASKIVFRGRPVIMVILRDISERKRAEQELRRTEREKAAILDSMSEFVVYHDNDMRIVWANRAAAEAVGLRPHQLTGCFCHQVWHNRSTPCEGCPVRKALHTGRTEEAEIASRANALWFVRGHPVRGAEGQVVGVVEVVLDITARKRAEEALAAEKERLAVTLRSIGDGVITTDTEGKVALINRVAEALTGWTQEEAIGKPLTDVFHVMNESTREPLSEFGLRIADCGIDSARNLHSASCSPPSAFPLEGGGMTDLVGSAVLRARDGMERIISDSSAPIHDKDGEVIGVVLVFRDITEKRKIERELVKASKLESVGLLAGGIAHDFNNILTGIVGNISLAKAEASPGTKILERLSDAEKASMRAKDLTQRLLTFSRGGAPIKRTASLAGLLRDSASFVLTGSTARCEFAIPDDLWPVEIDEGQISQVINNIVINADQAMPDGGVIRVSAENAAVGGGNPLPVSPGDYVRISIQDHGIGIPAEHLAKIFDPYFTTKQRGSGLGLATSYSIVKNHDGCITVESKLGAGSTFHIFLPAVKGEARPQRGEGERVHVGTGRVLVVDDEEIVRNVAGEMLRTMGYEVACVSDGAELLKMYKQAQEQGSPFDVVIMDLTIPGGMGGREAMQELLSIDPKAKAIVASGYSNDPIMSDFRKHGFCGVVAKPFQVSELGQTLSKVRSKEDE